MQKSPRLILLSTFPPFLYDLKANQSKPEPLLSF